MTATYDHEGFITKAKLFLNRAMDDNDRSFDERALWAAMALEVLGKAALARLSPLLIADTDKSGASMLIAAGIRDDDAQFVSVGASTVWARCTAAFTGFNERTAKTIAANRNNYVHGSAAVFTTMPEAAWWPKFWPLIEVLATSMDLTLPELLGDVRARVVETYLAQNKRNIADRTALLIDRAQKRLAQFEAGTLPARVAGEWRPGMDVSFNLKYREECTCPACGGDGEIEGEHLLNTEVEWERFADEYYEPRITLTVGTEVFGCTYCGLVLENYDLICEAGLPEEFEVIGDPDDLTLYEPEYGND